MPDCELGHYAKALSVALESIRDSLRFDRCVQLLFGNMAERRMP
jgi:hypothetical protein